MSEKPWRDEELVNHLYHDKEMSGPEIADKLGCSVAPIYERVEDTRSFSEASQNWLWELPPSVKTGFRGYERVRTKVDNEEKEIGHHRLIAVAEYGIEALKGKVVHHKNGIKWDNRPENIEVMSQAEHVEEHFKGKSNSER